MYEYKYITKIVDMKKLHGSVNGNPRWGICFKNEHDDLVWLRTKENSQVAYECTKNMIGNVYTIVIQTIHGESQIVSITALN